MPDNIIGRNDGSLPHSSAQPVDSAEALGGTVDATLAEILKRVAGMPYADEVTVERDEVGRWKRVVVNLSDEAAAELLGRKAAPAAGGDHAP